MDLGLAGKVAIVSGGSKGIGRAIAEELAYEGTRVVLAARGRQALDETVANIRLSGAAAIGVVADMSVASDVARVASVAQGAFGGVNIAISNTYPLHRPSLEGATDADFCAAHRGMLQSVVYLVRETLPTMRRGQWGRFVNIGSATMKEAIRDPAKILSNTYRRAVVGLNKSLADELGPDGITVNTLATGRFLTARLKASREARLGAVSWGDPVASGVAGVPAGRIGTTPEIASLCVFLCSDRAGYITGQTIAVDGGLTASY